MVAPHTRGQVLLDARRKLAREADETLGVREEAHRARIDQLVGGNGFDD
ncbi:hypothetical protein [Streptomyces sp. NPDC051994]